MKLPVGSADSGSVRTRRAYDRMARWYPLSTLLFHSRAHAAALHAAGIRDGMNVLEVATGSGEVFRRIARANPAGRTVGIDLSSRMAWHTHRRMEREFPDSDTHCQAADARHLPYRDHSFDAVVCCYLFELLGGPDIELALAELHRVLRHGGRLAVVCVGEDLAVFRRIYDLVGSLVPAFWGRRVSHQAPDLIRGAGFRLLGQRMVRQLYYCSRVLAAAKPT